ncbi:MAG TPA: M15 family metallopeptidase [Euzebya sp.]|nr:M15 family metallopeptidase [Euzebya sp.]
MTTSPALRTARPSIAVACAVLAVLTVLGTAPMPTDDARAGQDAASTDTDGVTFAELFEEMRSPESAGEGRGAVAVATTPPQIPEAQGGPAEVVETVAIPPIAESVTTARPTLLVRDVDPTMTEDVSQAPGVATAASATVDEVTLEIPGGSRTVTVAAVDPEQFRPLTPEITAQEAAVWERIIAGDAAFTHDAGTRLTVPLGTTVPLSGSDAPAVPEVVPAQDEGLRVGALASNGIPSVADALVSTDRGVQLGVTGPSDIYVAVADGADPEAVRQQLAALTGSDVELLEQPETRSNEFGAILVGSEARNFFEPFDYLDHGDGMITIDPGWVSRNIATTTQMPILGPGRVTCHRQMLIQLYGAFSEIEAAGLAPLIDLSQYGGCWVARHIDFNPAKPISMHGWGLAIDINVSTNGLGAQPTLDPRIVEIFDRWGFVWGGRWSRPDGMHFELGAVVDVPVPPGFFS